jgi:hypothetical protein
LAAIEERLDQQAELRALAQARRARERRELKAAARAEAQELVIYKKEEAKKARSAADRRFYLLHTLARHIGQSKESHLSVMASLHACILFRI